MIDDWLAKAELDPGHVRFYSDHASDAPVFEWADEPVAVNPHGKLRRLAQQRGWAIEDGG
jgi:phosphoserine phosphatase